MVEHVGPHFAKLWRLDELAFVEAIPKTSTGKFLKTKLRADYRGILGG